MPENPNHTCLVCNKHKHPGDRRDFCHRGEYLSTHLADGVDYAFNICDDCVLAWHKSGILHEDDDFTLSCAMCQRSCSAPGGHDTTLGVVFTAFLSCGAEDVRLCEGCLVGLFDAAEPEAKPSMFCTIDSQEMPSSKYNWDGSEKSMDAVVGAPEMKVKPIAYKIEIKPADAGAKEKPVENTPKKIVTGKAHHFLTCATHFKIVLEDGTTMSAGIDQWNQAEKECGSFDVGVEMVFYLDNGVYAWHPKDPMHGLTYAWDHVGSDSHGVFERVVLEGMNSQGEVHFEDDEGEGDVFWISNFEQAERRFGRLVPGTRYEWLLVESCGSDIVGWREAPLPKAEADTVSEPKDPMEGIDYRKEGSASQRFGVVSLVGRSVVHLSKTTSRHGDSWTCYDYAEVAKRCGELVPGKSYQFFFATKDWDLVGWKEAPIPDELQVFSYGHDAPQVDEPAPASPATAAPPADPPLSAIRFMAKRLGVRLPDDVASVGHATNVIEDALGAKMQQAMADTGFGVIHDILRALGINLEDNKGEPLGSYRHRVQAAIHEKIGQARIEGHDAGVNEVLKSLEDQIEYGEGQRKMLAEQLERVNVHRLTLQQVHADARKMRRGGAS